MIETKELRRKREIKKGDFYLEQDAAEWMDDIWNYYLLVSGDVDEIFGTNVCTSENDDYINVYASIYPYFDEIEDELDITLCRGDGEEESFKYILSDAEKKVLLDMVQQFEIARMQAAIVSRDTATN